MFQSYFSLTQQIMEGLRIEEHADKYTHDCSGGTKRKLSYGMAMLGTNNHSLLDNNHPMYSIQKRIIA